MALLDMAMALASDEQQRGCVTVEMKNNFLRPAGNVGDVKAFGMARHDSRSLAFCEAELRNSQDKWWPLLPALSSTSTNRAARRCLKLCKDTGA